MRFHGISFRVWTTLAAMLLVPVAVRAASPEGTPGPEKIFDTTTRADVNDLDMMVTNFGSFAFDQSSGNPGLIYPKGTDQTAVFAAGLWMGALVNGQLRTSVAAYSMTYGPGPILSSGEWTDPYDPRYRTYKIAPGDSPQTNPDYAEWPVEDGAPVGDDGLPRILGEQTIWSVFNDINPAFRTNPVATPDPLGIEVRHTTFAVDQPGGEKAVFLEWKILNKGHDALSDAYVSLWVDPDLGGATDDLVGCDTLLSLGYCYNATNNDAIYGSSPPAVGLALLQGPIVPSPADTAYVSGRLVPEFRNLPATAFDKWTNGTDPTSPIPVYNFMRGLAADGSVIIDPITGEPTHYYVPGDPVAGTGWLDSNPSDRRFLLSSGPFNMAPGDSQTVACAVIIGHGANRLASITILKAYTSWLPDLYRSLISPATPQPPDSTLTWTWSPEPRWLTGVAAGLSTFFGGIGYGSEFFGSTLADSQYVEVEIRFDSSEITNCARYDRNQGYLWVGNGVFRGSAYDVSNPNAPRRLNICFTEYDLLDGVWEPDSSVVGGREYLFIMNSSYDGGIEYDDGNYGPAADVLYAAWLRRRDWHPFFESDPARLRLYIPTSGIELADGSGSDGRNSANVGLRSFSVSPNPAREGLTMAFEVVSPGPIDVVVLDVAGRQVDRPVQELFVPAGLHRLDWSRPHGSTALPSGIYFWRIRAGKEVRTERVVLIH